MTRDERHDILFEPITPGPGSPEVCMPEQNVIDGKPMGRNVLDADNDVYCIGSAMARLLAEDGHEVTCAT